MIIDHKQKFVFVHVPKTGGQAVTHALGGKTADVATHSPLYACGVDRVQYFTFGFVRNPWDRLVSLYSFLCQKPFKKTDNFKQSEVRQAGFKRWLMEHEFFMQEDYLPVGESWVVGGKSLDDMKPMQRRSQLFWLEGCDHIGRFEYLADELSGICQIWEIKMPAPLMKINVTEHEHYKKYYDDESRQFVLWHFWPEIERFGYRF